MEPALVLDSQATLGEGAIWHADTGQLFFVDIEKKKLHRYHPKKDILRTIDVEGRIGTVVMKEGNSNKVIAAMQHGIYELDLEDGASTFLANPLAGMKQMRYNDGKCDPAGRFWVGTMHLESRPKAGALYRMEVDGTVEQVRDSVTVSNGIIWSLDQQTMYYIDTPTHCVQAYEYSLSTGHITNPRTVITIPEDTGHPDGMTIDEEGMLWIALWGGKSVGCWNPQTGKQLLKIDVPALHVTSCAFGGDDLSTLYITTARQGLSSEQLHQYPNSGGLFSVKPGTRGVKASLFGALSFDH